MPLVLKDRVKETTTTVSTGTYTLAGAVVGYQAFSVIGNGNTTYYAVTNGTDWEVGIGTYTLSGTTLSRDTILESSNSGNAVNWSAGVKEIFCTYPAERSMYVDGTTITPAISARLGFTNLAQGSALSVLGVTGNATADNASIAAGTDNQVLRRSGTSLAFGAVNLASSDAVTGDLPFSNLAQGSALSVLGVTGNATADNASIAAGTDHQVLRRSGTTVAFGAIALNQTAAVTGTLAAGNGGTGNAFFTVSGPATSIKTYTFPNENMSVGYLNIPAVADKTSSYILATSDIGKVVGVGSGGSITIPNSTFAAGDAVLIFNNTAGDITITCTITTAYIAGTDADVASVTLATRGVCNILFISGTVCVLTGNVS